MDKQGVLVLMAMVLGCCHLVASYTTKYDNIDLDEILSNDRLYKKYFDCLMGAGKCTPDGKELKDVLPDALANGCKECNEKQKAGSEKVLKYMVENKGEDFVKLEKIYDPEGKYAARYKAEAAAKGIQLPSAA